MLREHELESKCSQLHPIDVLWFATRDIPHRPEMYGQLVLQCSITYQLQVDNLLQKLSSIAQPSR